MILVRVSEWLPWRRDWSKNPTVWKGFAAYGVVAALIGCFYLVRGNRYGLAWLALAVVWAFATVYVRRRNRLGKGAQQPD